MNILGQYVNIRTGKLDANAANANGEYPFFTCAVEPLRINIAAYDCECVLVAGNGDLNVKYYNGKFNAYQRTYIIGSKSKDILSLNFLYRFIDKSLRQLRSQTKGGVIQYLRLNDLTDLKIDPPSLQDQLYIVNILSQAENLIAQRKESIRLLEEFLKNAFLEMFGDPVRNEKKWNVDNLNTVISGIDSGWSPVCLNKPRNNDSEWAILKLSSVTYRRFNPNANKLLDQNVIIRKELVPKKGDLLFSRKNTSELVGATVFVFEDYNRLLLPDTIFKINYLKDKISGSYLWFLFNHITFRSKIQSLASGAAGSMPNISKEKLSKLKISLPPLKLQTQFAHIVEKTEALKAQYQRSLQELENLYGSLSQRAFRGELMAKDNRLMLAAETEVKYLK